MNAPARPVRSARAQVIAASLDAIAEEMSATVTRTARSPLFNEAHDFTTGIFDFGAGDDGARLVAQAPGCTLHLYAIAGSIDAMLERFRFSLRPGDVLLLNDPYAGGTHGPDWTLAAPVFVEGRPLLLPTVRAHMGDNGGPVAGGYNPAAEEIWQEGLRIPPLRIASRGDDLRDVRRLLAANNRLSHWLDGDLAAMIGACRGAARRIERLAERHTAAGLREAIEQNLRYAESRARAAIATWPDGTYRGASFADHDFQGGGPVEVRAAVTVRGDELEIDLSESAPQAHGFVNSPLANTRSFAFASVVSALPDGIPINEGLMAPITVDATPGTVVNPLPPAPCGHATAVVGAEIAEAVLRALSLCVPERVGVNAHKLPLAYTHGTDPKTGEPFVNLNFFGYTGGAGAAYEVDGWGLYPPIMAGVTLPSIEMTETQYPCRIVEHEYAPDTAGAGTWRGAPGVSTVIEYLVPTRTHVMVTGHDHPIGGFCGGEDGSPSSVTLESPDADPLEVTTVANDIALPPGGRLRFRRGGGGGWGPPAARDPAAVRHDLDEGLLSPQAATVYDHEEQR